MGDILYHDLSIEAYLLLQEVCINYFKSKYIFVFYRMDSLSFFYVNRLDFRDTHQIKNYLNVMKNWNIDGAVKTAKIFYTDIFSKNLHSFFRRKLLFKKLHIDGVNFYAKCKGWKKFQREEHCSNCLVMMENEQSPWSCSTIGMEVCSSIVLSDYTCTHVTGDSPYS